MARPFAWTGVPRDDTDDLARPAKPAPETTTRLTGLAAFLAPWYRALFPMPPAEVRALKPTEAAAILGLDRMLAVAGGRALAPLRDEELRDTADHPIVMTRPAKGEQRLRKVV